MFGINNYWLFVVTVVLLILTPGLDTFYIVGRSLSQGKRIGVASALGISAGCVVHNLSAAFGLSAIIMASTSAFIVIKFVGAAYLVYLGARILFANKLPKELTALSVSDRIMSPFYQGLITNVLNPKVALFFLAFIPQFIDTNSTNKVLSFMVLGGTFQFTGTVWCIVLALAAAKLRKFIIQRSQVMGYLFRATGALFIVLGIRLAASKQ